MLIMYKKLLLTVATLIAGVASISAQVSVTATAAVTGGVTLYDTSNSATASAYSSCQGPGSSNGPSISGSFTGYLWATFAGSIDEAPTQITASWNTLDQVSYSYYLRGSGSNAPSGYLGGNASTGHVLENPVFAQTSPTQDESPDPLQAPDQSASNQSYNVAWIQNVNGNVWTQVMIEDANLSTQSEYVAPTYGNSKENGIALLAAIIFTVTSGS